MEQGKRGVEGLHQGQGGQARHACRCQDPHAGSMLCACSPTRRPTCPPLCSSAACASRSLESSSDARRSASSFAAFARSPSLRAAASSVAAAAAASSAALGGRSKAGRCVRYCRLCSPCAGHDLASPCRPPAAAASRPAAGATKTLFLPERLHTRSDSRPTNTPCSHLRNVSSCASTAAARASAASRRARSSAAVAAAADASAS